MKKSNYKTLPLDLLGNPPRLSAVLQLASDLSNCYDQSSSDSYNDFKRLYMGVKFGTLENLQNSIHIRLFLDNLKLFCM